MVGWVQTVQLQRKHKQIHCLIIYLNFYNVSYIKLKIYLRGPAYIIWFAWLLLFTVCFGQGFDLHFPCSALAVDRRRRSKSVSGVPLLNATAFSSVVCQHLGEILAAADLGCDASAG